MDSGKVCPSHHLIDTCSYTLYCVSVETHMYTVHHALERIHKYNAMMEILDTICTQIQYQSKGTYKYFQNHNSQLQLSKSQLWLWGDSLL